MATLEITKEFLEELLKKDVASFRVDIGSNPGDNYLSVMHAVEVNFKDEKESPLHLLVKCVPNHPARREFIEESSVFRKEYYVYNYWIPEFTKMQQEIGTQPPLQLPFATFLGGEVTADLTSTLPEDVANKNIYNYIVMVDLRKTFGMKMADRRAGIDYDHCKLVVEELAKMHAFSWAYKQRNGIKKLTDFHPMMIDNMFQGPSVEKFREVMDTIIENSLKAMVEGLGKESLAYKSAADRFNSAYDVIEAMSLFFLVDGIDEDAAENTLRIKPPHDPAYNKGEPWLVGAHGDCWVNNMLFRFNDSTGKPEKVILVDLQIYREACPTTDLVYFLYSSTTRETRRKHEKALLELYHDKFVEFCTALKCKPLPGFNLSSLTRRFHRAKCFGLNMALPILNFVLKDPDTAVDLDSADENKSMNDMFTSVVADSGKNVELKTRICELIQELYDQGVL